MELCEELSTPTHFALKRSEAMDFDNIDDTITFGTLKSEDSGIVLLNSPQSPDEEMKDLVADHPSPSNVDKLNTSIMSTESTGASVDAGLGSSRRRSSTGTYSSADDDDDCRDEQRRTRDDEGTGVALSEDETNEENGFEKRGQGNRDDLFLKISDTATSDKDGDKDGEQLTTENSPVDKKIHSSPDQEEKEPPKIEEPRVDFTRGLRCTEVTRAIEILRTRYRLPDAGIGKHRCWSVWGKCDYSVRTHSRQRHHPYEAAPEGSKQLKDICLSIERRHQEIAQILEKLLELDAANKAEAEALLRLAGSKASAVGDGDLTSPDLGPGSAAAAVNPSLFATDNVQPTVGSNSNMVGQSRSLKRRNPFSRAVYAIRKRFSARPQQPDQPVPAAA